MSGYLVCTLTDYVKVFGWGVAAGVAMSVGLAYLGWRWLRK